MIKNIPLTCIDPNPFQVRSGEDPEHVKNLALSIGEVGLLQIPTGRLMGGTALDNAEALRGNSVEQLINGGHRVQLAFGHSRLAAFKFLRDTGNLNFAEMPVNITELTDEQMFQAAVAENLDRKDISVMDEARAMVVYRDHFKKTSAEIGGLFHLADSSVRNKIRLLQLPEEIQKVLNEGKLSEGAGRALLELFDLPEQIRKAGEAQWQQEYKPSWIVRKALAGEMNADQIHNSVEYLVRGHSVELGKETQSWKYDEVFEGPDLVGACRGCQYMVRREKQDLCLKSDCYYAKVKIVKRRYIEQASLLIGIPILEGDSSSTSFNYTNENVLPTARAAHCPNLRLAFDVPYRDDKSDHLGEIGFPNAQIVCCKQEQWCSCVQAVKAGLASRIIEKATSALPEGEPGSNGHGDPAEVPADAPAPGQAAITNEALKEIGKEIRQKKKENLADIQGMEADAARQIATELLDINTNPKLLLALLSVAGGNTWDIEKQTKGDFSENPQAWCDEIRLEIGKIMISKRVTQNYYYSEPNPDVTLSRLNEYLKTAGLPELVYAVSAETKVVQ